MNHCSFFNSRLQRRVLSAAFVRGLSAAFVQGLFAAFVQGFVQGFVTTMVCLLHLYKGLYKGLLQQWFGRRLGTGHLIRTFNPDIHTRTSGPY